MNYYNEYDPHCVQWLEALIDRGLIPPGEVDGRSIRDVEPSDLKGFVQCHFFVGIAGWSYALQLAGWPDRPASMDRLLPLSTIFRSGKAKKR